MMANININQLSGAISKELQTYTKEVSKGLEKAKIESANEGVKTLKVSSPKRTGDYSQGWARKKIGNSQVIHNETNYQITHLLENGYAKKNGGRVSPQVHIAPVEAAVIKDYEDRVEKVIRG